MTEANKEGELENAAPEVNAGDVLEIVQIRCAGCGELKPPDAYSEQERARISIGAHCRPCLQQVRKKIMRTRNNALWHRPYRP